MIDWSEKPVQAWPTASVIALASAAHAPMPTPVLTGICLCSSMSKNLTLGQTCQVLPAIGVEPALTLACTRHMRLCKCMCWVHCRHCSVVPLASGLAVFLLLWILTGVVSVPAGEMAVVDFFGEHVTLTPHTQSSFPSVHNCCHLLCTCPVACMAAKCTQACN